MIALAVPRMAVPIDLNVPRPAEPLRETPVLEAPKSPLLPEIFERIVWCESRNRQFDKSGKPLRGTLNYYDIGKFQINEQFWGKEADKLGYDLATEEGNEAMALEIYRRQGTKPWNGSKTCWQKVFVGENSS